MFPDSSKKHLSRNVCLRIDLNWCFRIYPKRNCQIMVHIWFILSLWFVIDHMTHMFHCDHHSSNMLWIKVVSRHLKKTVVTTCGLTYWLELMFPDISKKRLSRHVRLRIDLNWCFQIAPKKDCHAMCAYGLIWIDVSRHLPKTIVTTCVLTVHMLHHGSHGSHGSYGSYGSSWFMVHMIHQLSRFIWFIWFIRHHVSYGSS